MRAAVTSKVAALSGLLLASAPLGALPAHATADQQQKAGCCEALAMWLGAVHYTVVLPDRGSLRRSVPPGWTTTDKDPHFYLPRNKKIPLVTTFAALDISRPSRARYRWNQRCLSPLTNPKSSRWTWTKVPGKAPSPTWYPVKNIFGSVNIGSCPNGMVWVEHDQGDHRYAHGTGFNFSPGHVHPTSRTLKVWRWVTAGQAKSVRRTGKYPVPRGTLVGQYFFTSRAYANKVRGQFPGYRLVQGTLLGSDLLFYFTENKRTDTGLVGGFFDKSLKQPKKTFKVVK